MSTGEPRSHYDLAEDDMVSSTVVTVGACWSYADLGEVFAEASWEGACQGTYESPGTYEGFRCEDRPVCD